VADLTPERFFELYVKTRTPVSCLGVEKRKTGREREEIERERREERRERERGGEEREKRERERRRGERKKKREREREIQGDSTRAWRIGFGLERR